MASSVLGFLRMVGYSLSMVVFGSALTVAFVVSYPLAKWLDPELHSYAKWTMAAARWAMRPYVRVVVKGAENIPKGGAYVIVPNHQSNIDPSILANAMGHLRFKTVFKKELLLTPGVGSALYLAGHIPVNRSNKNSGKATIDAAKALLSRGISVLFFSEGTRKIDPSAGPLGEFKPGAFIAAYDCQVPVLPVTISGARGLLPPSGLLLRSGEVTVTIHKAMAPPATLAAPKLLMTGGKGAAAAATTATPAPDTPAAEEPVLAAHKLAVRGLVDGFKEDVRRAIGTALRPVDAVSPRAPASSSTAGSASAAASGPVAAATKKEQ